jgi:hypothetical protein
MKLSPSIVRARASSGALLVECLVYIGIFALILGLAMVTFYLCWDNSEALLYATDDISAALRAGERWRADVRSATGGITVETNADYEQLRIPSGTNEILYRFSAGEVRRQLGPAGYSEPLLSTVQTSQMIVDTRGPVKAWRWELEMKLRRKETHLPLLFTFEAAQTKP